MADWSTRMYFKTSLKALKRDYTSTEDATTLGNPYGYWTISPLLSQLAAHGRRLLDWKAT